VAGRAPFTDETKDLAGLEGLTKENFDDLPDLFRQVQPSMNEKNDSDGVHGGAAAGYFEFCAQIQHYVLRQQSGKVSPSLLGCLAPVKQMQLGKESR
jgi:hypothetical protein